MNFSTIKLFLLIILGLNCYLSGVVFIFLKDFYYFKIYFKDEFK